MQRVRKRHGIDSHQKRGNNPSGPKSTDSLGAAREELTHLARQQARVLVIHGKDDEMRTETHRDEDGVTGNDRTAAPQAALTEDSIKRLSRKGVASGTDRIDERPDLHRALQEEVIRNQSWSTRADEKCVRTSPSTKRKKLLPHRSLARTIAERLPN